MPIILLAWAPGAAHRVTGAAAAAAADTEVATVTVTVNGDRHAWTCQQDQRRYVQQRCLTT